MVLSFCKQELLLLLGGSYGSTDPTQQEAGGHPGDHPFHRHPSHCRLGLPDPQAPLPRPEPGHGQERFDGTVVPHAHFICKCCGRVLDLHKLPSDGELDRAAEAEYGVEVDCHELIFRGTCQKCKQSMQSA